MATGPGGYVVQAAPAHSRKGAVVAAQNLTYTIGDKKILDNVSFIARPGHLMAIMGPSGSGKTTFLNALAGRIQTNKKLRLSGIISCDGDTSGEVMRDRSNYVMQQEHLEEFLTVRETLRFAAQLKLSHLTPSERQDRVEAVIRDLGLQSAQHVAIGGPSKKGLSGGQKKRVSIAAAMLADPDILFLDEPTSGLDSSLAHDVLKVLVRLAKAGRTVICTVHQPRSQVFVLFDQLMLLSQGRAVYMGPAVDAEPYFSTIGHVCPRSFNPADFFLDLLSADPAGIAADEDGEIAASYGDAVPAIDHDKPPPGGSQHSFTQLGAPGKRSHESLETILKSNSSMMVMGRVVISEEEVAKLPELFAQSKYGRFVVEEVETEMNRVYEQPAQRKRKTPKILQEFSCSGDSPVLWCRKFYTLSSRMFLNTMRNPFTAITQVSINVVFGLIIGGIFWKLASGGSDADATIAAQRNRVGYLFFIAIHFMFANMDSLLVFPKERITFNRETAEGLYDPSAYFCARCIADLLVQQIPGAIFATITYLMGGLGGTVSQFFVFLLISQVMVFTASSYCYMFGAGVKSFEIANVTAPVVAVVFLLVGGFYLQDADIPPWISWFRYIDYLRFGFFALFQNELREGDVVGWGEGAMSAEYVARVFGIPLSPNMWVNTLVTFLLGIAYRFIAFLLLKYVNRHIGVQA